MSSPDYSSDSSSDRSYDARRNTQVCPYQTPQFHYQECSRFFDCPTHTIERAGSDYQPSEAEQELDDDADEAEDGEENDTLEEHGNSSELRDMSPLGRDAPPAEQLAEAAPEPRRNLESTRAGKQRQEVIDLTNSPPETIAGPSNVIDLTGDSNTSSSESVPRASALVSNQERALPTIPDSASGSSVSLSRTAGVTPSAQRRPATPPSPPPPTRRRTSTNHFGGAPPPSRQPQQQRPSASRRPSDIVLPRWQPDAEVTICPICRTQFSFLVRKHHCRCVLTIASFLGESAIY